MDAGYPVEITLDGQQVFQRGYLATDILPWIASVDPGADGKRLRDKLFADRTLSEAWAAACAQTSAQPRRIRLRIDDSAAELHALPWELLQEGPVMLAAQANTPFSRYLAIALPWGGAVEERPIRVLAVLSNPADLASYELAAVDVEVERELLQSALQGVPDLQVDFLPAPASLAKIEEALRGGYHILHFVGHGAFDPKSQKAVLFMQDGEGNAALVHDEDFVRMVARQGVQPRLVFLSACQSATRSPKDAFLGLAPKLVRVGVPAVIAMQDKITMDSAHSFSATFYRRLLEHGQVDQAINEARSTLLTGGRSDAGVPVLFMRLQSGLLWSAESDGRGRILGNERQPSAARVFWQTLLRRIEEGACVPVVGPRVHGRWLPTPHQIAQRWAQTNDYPFSDKDNLAHVSQYIDTTGGEDFSRSELLDSLMSEFKARLPQALRPAGRYKTLTELVRAVGWPALSDDNPNEVHRVLAGLDLPLYLTTNCDSFMYEALAARKGSAARRDWCRWNEDLTTRFPAVTNVEPDAQTPLAYHLFGSDEQIKSLIVTEDHYLDFLTHTLTRKERIPYAIRGKLAESVLLFLGYNLYDWEFRVVMRGLVATVDFKYAYKHVAVQLEDVSEADAEAVRSFLQQYFQRAQINVFWGSSAQFIAELRERWEEGGHV